LFLTINYDNFTTSKIILKRNPDVATLAVLLSLLLSLRINIEIYL